jgi:hypothetical protein
MAYQQNIRTTFDRHRRAIDDALQPEKEASLRLVAVFTGAR